MPTRLGHAPTPEGTPHRLPLSIPQYQCVPLLYASSYGLPLFPQVFLKFPVGLCR
jgi:hypothetical protein